MKTDLYSIVIASAFIASSLFSLCAQASDTEREARMRAEIEESILDGEAVDLTAGKQAYWGIYTEADEARGATLILHGRGYHPDWQDFVQPVRVGLIESGWNTLSIQLPVLHKEAKYYDYVPLFAEANERISASIAWLREQGNEKIVLIAHSCGAHMAMDWVRNAGDKDITAYVGVGMGATDYKQPMQQPFPLASMQIPVLDVYGELDYPSVLRMAEERKTSAKNPASSQIIIPAAKHYMADKGDEVTEAISNWLETLH